MSRNLRKAAWASKDLVEKWTILVDVGRAALAALWSGSGDASNRRAPTAARPTTSQAKERSDCWRVTGESPATSGGSSCSVPYPIRLQVSLSLLMWVRCLRDVQDTLARLHQPYAPLRRLPTGIVVADVFPTRLAERLVDPCSFVEATVTDPVEQLPLPHLIHEDEADATAEPLSRSGEVVVDRVRRAHGLPVRLSDDDEKAKRMLGRSTTRRPRQRGSTGSGPYSSSAAPSLPRHCDHQLEVLEREVDADATYHENMFRPEGSPLDDFGTLSVCPIFVEGPVPLPQSAPPSSFHGSSGNSSEHQLHQQQQRQVYFGALLRAFVSAHTSILSSLFIEGRVVDFTTNATVLMNYVTTVFDPLIQEGFLRVSRAVEEEVVDASAAKEISAAARSLRRPYIADWVLQHAWVVNPKVFASEASVSLAVELVQRSSLNISPLVIVHSDDAKAALLRSVSREATPGVVRSEWVVRVEPGLTNDEHRLRETLSRCFMVSLLSPDTTWLRLQRAHTADPFVERVQSALEPCCRLVAVNAFAMDLWAFYPHASVLPQKVGNAFRIRSVRRTTLRRPWGRNWSVCALGLDVPDVLRCCSGDGAKEEASDALRLERSLSFLAQPTRATALGLISAKMLRL